MGSRTWWRWMVVVAAAFATAGLQAGEISARRNSARPSDKKPSSLSYNRDILPILSDNCFACHGPDKNTREAKLRLDVREAAVGKRRKGFAIKPGHPAASLVMKRILTDDPDELMPPPDSTKKLTDAQKKLIRRWIEQGAEYDPHWAYIRPKRFSVPKVPGSGWVQRNPIDGFIHLSLKSHGLRPSPEADR
ncbi:MAG: c-type cytochrome domain-containing protein, partial [Phycisphaeraceae bacterium]|nr:c-type cytochrome domain-containing protein [Phycisphaeraceae bacterium]